MRLVVTGGAGYIGSVVVEAALAAGHEVTAIDTLTEGHAAAVAPGARLVVGDVGDPGLVDAVFSHAPVDAVVHMAAETTIAASMVDPIRYFRQNTAATLTLVESMRRFGVPRIVFSSTAAVYGEPTVAPIPETHATRPINPYGESKLAAERLLDWCGRAYGIGVVIFRYFNAAGATAARGEAHRHESHLIPLVFRAVTTGHPLSLHGTDYPTPDGTCIRDFVHVADIADAHLQALAYLAGPTVARFNLGTGTGHTVRQVIDEVERVSGRPVPVTPAARRPGDPAILVADGRLAQDTLSWRPRRSTLAEIVASAWAWTSAHPQGYGA